MASPTQPEYYEKRKTRHKILSFVIGTMHRPSVNVPKFTRATVTMAAWTMVVVGIAATAIADKGIDRKICLLAVACGCLSGAALQTRLIKLVFACDRRVFIAPWMALAAVFLAVAFIVGLFFIEQGVMRQMVTTTMAILGGLLLSLKQGLTGLHVIEALFVALSRERPPPSDILQLLNQLRDKPHARFPNLEFDGLRLIGSQAAMAKVLKIPVTSVNRQIRALAKRNVIDADTSGGLTFLSLVSCLRSERGPGQETAVARLESVEETPLCSDLKPEMRSAVGPSRRGQSKFTHTSGVAF